MKIYVDELPKSSTECPFQEDGICKVCGMSCHIDDCKCLVKFQVEIKTEE